MKQNIKVNIKYKLYNAISFLLVYIVFILLYTFKNGLCVGLFENGLVWGFSIALLYYTLICRTKIIIDKEKLICKPANELFIKKIHIHSIHKIVIKKRFFFINVVVFYGTNNQIRLYPANALDLVNFLKDSCNNSNFEVEDKTSSIMKV